MRMYREREREKREREREKERERERAPVDEGLHLNAEFSVLMA
jgi:hypothetical protein